KSRSWRRPCTTHCSRIKSSNTENLWTSCRRTSYARPWRNSADRCCVRAENMTVRCCRRGWSCSIKPI
ncbi:hypothetical protein M9458_041333, partial [Cirrhinus mrigala]